MCYLKRGKEKRLFTSRFICDCTKEGILLFDTNVRAAASKIARTCSDVVLL